jgi:drug/metabolite transporter (DMT)-like permease
MSVTTSVTAPPVAAHHWHRLVILLLGVALAAMTALTVYLAATRTSAATGQTTSPTPPGTSQADPCYRQAVPC